MKSASLIIMVLMLYLDHLFAQAESKTKFKMEGQIAATTNGKAVCINFGGPAMKFTFSKLAASLCMIPSIKFENDKPKPIVTPLLGFGLQLYFLKDRRYVLSFPCYYFASRNIWILSAGMGYVLTKPK